MLFLTSQYTKMRLVGGGLLQKNGSFNPLAKSRVGISLLSETRQKMKKN